MQEKDSNLRKCCNQSQRLCGFLKELNEPGEWHRRRPSYLLRVKVSRLKKRAPAELWPRLLVCFSKRPRSQECSVKLNIPLQTSESTPPSVSPTLIYTSIAVTHVTNNCVWVQSSFARFSCFTFIFSDLQVFFRAKNLKLVDVILALILQMWHLCDLQRLQVLFFFRILLQALMFNNSTIKWYSNVFCFDLCESPVWIYTVAFESEALWCDVNKR